MNYLLKRSLFLYWKGDELLLEDFETQRLITLAPIAVQVLSAFSSARSKARVAALFSAYSSRSVARTIDDLEKSGLILPVSKFRAHRLQDHPVWMNGFIDGAFHFSTRNPDYLDTPVDQARFYAERLAESPQPSFYKVYKRSMRVQLPQSRKPRMTLVNALDRRRTVRQFQNKPVRLADLSLLLRKTWGQAGWLPPGLLGRLPRKTSPSAGARHPTECYVIAWAVEALSPGIYHYSVRDDCLARLRSGDFREESTRIVAGMGWLADAAFVCVMTAVINRVFWKYPMSGFYRLLLLDAGHLGQTFCLLATALGLGPFTSAAIRHTQAEALLGINGIDEVPVYVCGAGYPLESKSRRGG